MPTYTTDSELIPQVKRLAHIPLSQNTFLAADLCAFGNDELRTSILNQIISVRESYYLTSVSYTLDSGGIYPIPSRAIGGKIHDAQMVVGNSVYQLARIEPKDLNNTVNPPTNSYAFYFQGNYIVTIPVLTSGVLTVWFYVRPSNLVAEATCCLVTAITATTVSVSAIASGYAANTVIDFTQAQPPFGLLSYDQAIVSVDVPTTTFTFAAGVIPSDLVIGDWICLAGTSCVPQIPLEFHPLLAQRISVKVLESQGYMQKMELAQKKLMEMEKALFNILNPRSEGNAKKISPNRNLIQPGPGLRGNTWFVSP